MQCTCHSVSRPTPKDGAHYCPIKHEFPASNRTCSRPHECGLVISLLVNPQIDGICRNQFGVFSLAQAALLSSRFNWLRGGIPSSIGLTPFNMEGEGGGGVDHAASPATSGRGLLGLHSSITLSNKIFVDYTTTILSSCVVFTEFPISCLFDPQIFFILCQTHIIL